jgi:hypothetical protein
MSDYLAQAERALKYLEESEEEFARLKALHQAEDKRRKIVRASCFIDAEGSVAERNAKAESHVDYEAVVGKWEQAMDDFYLVDAKRKRAEITIEMFRSVNSSMKRGNI